MSIDCQFLSIGQPPFLSLAKLARSKKNGRRVSADRHPVIFSKRLLRQVTAVIIALFLPTCCLSASQVEQNPKELPELVVQSGHVGSIVSMTFFGDDYLATASADGTAKIWRVATGQLLRTFRVSENWVFSLVFSPDGKLLATGSGDNTVRIWEIATGRQLQVLKGHAHAVRALAFSPDGKSLASGSAFICGESPNTLISVWEVSSGKRLFHVDEVGVVEDLTLSGPTKLAAQLDSGAKTWELDSYQPENLSTCTTKSIVALAFVQNSPVTITSSDKRWTAVSHGASFTLFDRGNKITTEQPRPLAVRAINFSTDGKLIAVGQGDGNLTLWDAESGRTIRTFQGQEKSDNNIVHSVGFTPDTANVFAATWNSGIWLWNLSQSGAPREAHKALNGLAVKDEASGSRMSAEVNPLPTGAPPSAPTRLTARVDSEEPSPMTEEVYTTAIAPSGKWLAFGGYSWNNAERGGFFSVIDWETLQKIDDLFSNSGGSVQSSSFSPNGKILAIGYSDGRVGVRDIANHTFIYLTKGHSRSTNAVAFSPNGRLLASGGSDTTVKIWDVSSGKLLSTLEGHSASVLSVTFSRDGTKLISGGLDNEIIVWDTESGRRLQSLTSHTSAVNALAISQRSDLLVSGSEDGTITFWGGSPYQPLATAVSFGEDDWLVFSPQGFFDGTPQAWQLAPFRFPSEPARLYQPEQFFNEFYQPNLLADVLANGKPLLDILHERNDPRADADVAAYRRSSLPNLHIAYSQAGEMSTQRTIEITIEAQDTGSGLRDLRVFRNQSLVHVEHGELHADPLTKTYRLMVPVKIVAGLNNFTAYVFNRDNIKSKDASIVVTGSPALKRSGKAYIVAIGINQYSNPAFDLHFAKADAQAFADALSHSMAQLRDYDQVVPIVLFDDAANKRNIEEVLGRLAGAHLTSSANVPAEIQTLEQAEPEDAVFIYFAGHGAAQGDRYYLIPHDLGYAGDPKHIGAQDRLIILKSSLSDLDLEQILEKIDSRRLLLVIDSCQSGQVLEAEEKRRGPMNSRGLAQLAYEKGAYILAAAQSYQAALEFKRLGHGILTYVLVEEGLGQYAADSAPRDGVITVGEWLQYATRQVPSEIQSLDQERLKVGGRDVDYGEITITGQAPRSYFRPDVDAWILAKTPNQAVPR